MDASRFDDLVSSISNASSRRNVIKLLGGTAAAGLAAVVGLSTTSLLDVEEAEAKKKTKKNRGKKRRRRRCKPQPAGASCQTNQDCCTKQTKRICAVAKNAGNSDRTCCGGTGAVCGAPNEDGDDTAPFCCAGFDCALNSGTGGYTCQPVPDEL